MRNLAVIAHVDHGKTTLSDALLLKAGLLHKDRAGDQDKGRSLDTLKDEKERGITIKSAAVTLTFQVKERLLNKGPSNPNAPVNSDGVLTTEVYIGNLPHNYSEQDVRDLLTCNNIPVESIQLPGRRAYGIVRVLNRLVPSLLALNGTNIAGGDAHDLVVQRVGDSPMILLKDECDSRGVGMPTITATVVEENSTAFTGKAVWPALGGVIIQSTGSLKSAKQARQAAAQECLEFLGRYHESSRKEVCESSLVAGGEGAADGTGDVDKNNSDDSLGSLVVNLIDTPGHSEFNAEVTAALRVSDGCLLVVDAVEGMAVQTKVVLMQALREGVKPVLMLNKVDRLLVDKQQSAEDVYDSMAVVVDDVNTFIAAHQLEQLPDLRVSFKDGSVCFGSGYFGWSCSIDAMCGESCPIGKREMQRKYLAKRENFIQHILRPIIRMHRLTGVLPMKKQLDSASRVSMITELLSKRFLGAGDNWSAIEPRKLLKKAMMTWLPAADALIDMVVAHVPSPVLAQSMRAQLLYSGEMTDVSGQGICGCDSSGPAIVYISKIVPGHTKKKTVAFGRVFSGTIRPGDSMRALRTNGTESTVRISSIKICDLKGMHAVSCAEAGQLIALGGIENALYKAGTLTSDPNGQAINHMTFAVSPVVQHAVRPKVKSSLAKMVAGLHQVVHTDSTALFYKDPETQQHILAGAGELHIEVLVSSFVQNTGIEIELSEPIICYRETVQSASEDAVLAKSDNKHNRIWVKASPIDDDLVEAMASGSLTGVSDLKEFRRRIAKDFCWDRAEAAKIWSIGPAPLNHGGETTSLDQPTCLLLDSTFGLNIPEDAKANIVAAFLQVARQGVLANAPMRGVRFDLVDAKFHSDAVHRRPNSVVPAASRALRGAFLKAGPNLMEPMHIVGITGESGTLNSAYAILGHRGGVVVDSVCGAATDTIQARAPVRTTFGLSGALREASRGHAHCTCTFDGMQLVPSFELADIIEGARVRKGLSKEIPVAETFIDKL